MMTCYAKYRDLWFGNRRRRRHFARKEMINCRDSIHRFYRIYILQTSDFRHIIMLYPRAGEIFAEHRKIYT